MTITYLPMGVDEIKALVRARDICIAHHCPSAVSELLGVLKRVVLDTGKDGVSQSDSNS